MWVAQVPRYSQERQHGKEEEFSHLIHCGHLLCRLTQVCELKYVPGNMGVIHHPGKNLCGSAVEVLTPSTSE